MPQMTATGRIRPARESRLVFTRLQRIHQMLSDGRCPTLDDLARELEVSTRTVERDLQQLRDLYAPVIYDRARRGYRYERPFQLPPFKISAGELAVLLIGQRLLAEMAGTPFAEAARTVIAKLPAMLGEQVSFDPNAFINEEISFGVPAVRGDEGRLARHFNRLAEAIAHQRTVSLRYYAASKDAVRERDVDPYHLRLADGAWYLIGHCHLRNELRIFAVDRILELTVTSRTFTKPADFSIDDYLGLSWGIERGPERTVRVAFDAEEARWIRERTWHRSQRLTETDDGGVILEVRVSGLDSIKRWILSFGSHARVLEPAELAEAVRREAEGMLRGEVGVTPRDRENGDGSPTVPDGAAC